MRVVLLDGALLAALVAAAPGVHVAEAKEMNPIHQPHHLVCPPGFHIAGGRCIKVPPKEGGRR